MVSGADTDASEGWRARYARHQAPLDAALRALQASVPAHALLVVVRTGEQRTRYARLLRFPNQVLTLATFLGIAGPQDIRDDDLVPPLIVRRIVERALPPDYQRRGQELVRRHMAAEVEKALHLLDEQGTRLPAGGPTPRGELVAALRLAQRALDDARRGLHDQGLWSAGERVAIAAQGPSRLLQRFPDVTHLAFIGFDALSPRERAAVTETVAPARAVHWFVVGAPEGEHPALRLSQPLLAWLARRGPLEDLGAGSPRVAALAGLFADDAGTPTPLEGVAVVRPDDRRVEVERAVRWAHRLVQEGEGAHTIALVVPELAAYAPLLTERLSEHGLPYAISHPGPTRTTPSGTFLRLLLDDLDQDHERDALLDLVTHPLADWRLPLSDDDGDDNGPRARLRLSWLRTVLGEHGLRPRRLDGWRAAVAEIAHRADLALDAPPQPRTLGAARALDLQGLLRLVERLDALKANDDGTAFLDDLRVLLDHAGLGRGLARALRQAGDPTPLVAGQQRLLDILDQAEEAARLVEPPPGTAEVREWLRALLWRDSLPATGDPEHGIQVTSLRNVRALCFAHVRVLGCTQDALPAPDRDRALVQLLEALTEQRFERLDPDAEARRILHGILCDTTGSVVLSAPAHEGDAEVAASVLLEELAEACRLDDALRDRIEAQDVVPASPRDALRLAGLERRGVVDPPASLMAATTLVEARTTGDDSSPYAARVTHAVATLVAPHPRALEDEPERLPALSARPLEAYALCPFRALVGQGLRIRVPVRRDEGAGPFDRGLVLHHVLDAFGRAALAQAGGPVRFQDVQGAPDLLVGIVNDAWERIRFRSVLWDAFRVELVAGLPSAGNPYRHLPPGILARFLRREAQDGARLLATETPFGMKDGPDVVIETPDGPLPLRGWIDRVDLVGPDPGALRVFDYKTGTLPKRALTLGGVHFQLPLYLNAAKRLFPDRPLEGADYYGLRRTASGGFGPPRRDRYVAATPADEHAVERLVDETTPMRIAALLRSARAGHFGPTLLSEEEAGCAHCDMRRVCGMRSHLQRARRERALVDAPGERYIPDHLHIPAEGGSP